MNVQMITPTVVDWDADGDPDLVVGDEDGRVALVENSGKIRGGDSQSRRQPRRDSKLRCHVAKARRTVRRIGRRVPKQQVRRAVEKHGTAEVPVTAAKSSAFAMLISHVIFRGSYENRYIVMNYFPHVIHL